MEANAARRERVVDAGLRPRMEALDKVNFAATDADAPPGLTRAIFELTLLKGGQLYTKLCGDLGTELVRGIESEKIHQKCLRQ
jgi:hypothetical protein